MRDHITTNPVIPISTYRFRKMTPDNDDDDEVAEVDAEEIDEDDDSNDTQQAITVTSTNLDIVDDDDDDDDAVEASVQGEDEDDEDDDDDDDDDDEGMTVKSIMSNDSFGDAKPVGGKKRKKPCPPTGKKARQPAVLGLTIPFRATKRTMKLDPDIGTVQNEAAILTTLAAELFVKSLATESHIIAKSRGRNTIRYEDLAEARTKDPALSFLATILP
jgi:histone H3/H4